MRLILFLWLNFTMSSLFPNAILTEMGGKQIHFKSLAGQWVMINYWASWCQPCLDEIQELNAFYRDNRDKVALYAVNYDGLSIQQQQQLIQKYQITYPSLQDDPAKSLKLGAIVGVPATYIFNPGGQWVNTLYGGQTSASLKQSIQ